MKLRSLGVLVIVILLLISCGKKSDKKGIDLNVKISPDVITDFLYVKLNYRFKLTDGFKSFDDDYKFFVHFWRKKTKEMLIQDDHSPEKPFSQWKSGETVTYSRIVFIPQFIDEFDSDFEGNEDIRLTVGVYNPADAKSSITLFQQDLNVRCASWNAPAKMYAEGWYQPETDLTIKNSDEQSWRWTGKKAVCMIGNPRKESLLIIRGGVDKSILPDQKLIFKINDTILEEFVPETAKFSKRYVIKPGTLGNEVELKLTIETDKTFIPSTLKKEVKDSKDNRELGIQIFFLYFRENIE